jgi:hypothetical protein
MANYPVVLQGVLDRIEETLDVNIEDYEDEGEWFGLECDNLEDCDLFARLKLEWNRIVGIHSNSFALLYWPGGPYEGVWVHYLATAHLRGEYLAGYHRVT